MLLASSMNPTVLLRSPQRDCQRLYCRTFLLIQQMFYMNFFLSLSRNMESVCLSDGWVCFIQLLGILGYGCIYPSAWICNKSQTIIYSQKSKWGRPRSSVCGVCSPHAEASSSQQRLRVQFPPVAMCCVSTLLLSHHLLSLTAALSIKP